MQNMGPLSSWQTVFKSISSIIWFKWGTCFLMELVCKWLRFLLMSCPGYWCSMTHTHWAKSLMCRHGNQVQVFRNVGLPCLMLMEMVSKVHTELCTQQFSLSNFSQKKHFGTRRWGIELELNGFKSCITIVLGQRTVDGYTASMLQSCWGLLGEGGLFWWSRLVDKCLNT